MKIDILPFQTRIGKQKPNTLLNPTIACPFCDIDSLQKSNNVVEKDGGKIWVLNKYPVFTNSYPLVYIEQSACGMNISNYPKEVLMDVLQTGIIKWLEMLNDDQYKSVIFMKNHGPYSSGSISHPHMQLIGFYDQEPPQNISFDNIGGPTIYAEDGFQWNFSEQPFSEFYEWTIRLKDMKKFPLLAHAIQSTTHYILNHLNKKYQSFNLCFYHVNGEIIVKVFNRLPNSPLFLGYRLVQLPDDLEKRADDMRTLYSFQ